ncbi:unnamed protein product [Sphenostylis stenocarpa]|uniref:Uncharacterized protein n=1 Tax=Sphenostylis stenocarpa TaxID=92480 RepID=A0AA86T1J6_9FABA|nr:unnamed protein product [Sphenostylis stenocarpa]
MAKRKEGRRSLKGLRGRGNSWWPKSRACSGRQRSDLGPCEALRGVAGLVRRSRGEEKIGKRDDRDGCRRDWDSAVMRFREDKDRLWRVGDACGATKVRDGWSRGDLGDPRW